MKNSIIYFILLLLFIITSSPFAIASDDDIYHTVQPGENFFRIVTNHIRSLKDVSYGDAFEKHEELNRQQFQDFTKIPAGARIQLLSRRQLLGSDAPQPSKNLSPGEKKNPVQGYHALERRAPASHFVGPLPLITPLSTTIEQPLDHRRSLKNLTLSAFISTYGTQMTVEDLNNQSTAKFRSELGQSVLIKVSKSFHRKFGMYGYYGLNVFEFSDDSQKSFEDPENTNQSRGLGFKFSMTPRSILFFEHGIDDHSIVVADSASTLSTEKVSLHKSSLKWSYLLYYGPRWMFSISPQGSYHYPSDVGSLSVKSSWSSRLTSSLYYSHGHEWTFAFQPTVEWSHIETGISKQSSFNFQPIIGVYRSF